MFTLWNRSSLWDGGDHLLVVENKGFHETYSRFDYGEIQALVMCQNERRLYLGLFLAFFLVIGLIALVGSSGAFGKAFGGALTFVFGISTLVNALKGPGCVCHIKTRVNLMKLRPITRRRQFERILPDLRSRIAERQGEADPGELLEALGGSSSAGDEEDRPTGVPPRETPSQRSPVARVEPVRGAVGKGTAGFHLALFSILLGDAALTLFAFAGPSSVAVALRGLLALAAVLCAIGALVEHRKRVVPDSLRNLAIASIVYYSIGVVTVYILFVVMNVQDPESVTSTVALFQVLADVTPYDGRGWFALFSGNVLLSALLGSVGLFQALAYRKEGGVPPLPPRPSTT